MSLQELLPSVQKLSRADRVRLMKYLVDDLVEEETPALKDHSYPVWTPLEAFDAAETLLEAIKQDNPGA